LDICLKGRLINRCSKFTQDSSLSDPQADRVLQLYSEHLNCAACGTAETPLPMYSHPSPLSSKHCRQPQSRFGLHESQAYSTLCSSPLHDVRQLIGVPWTITGPAIIPPSDILNNNRLLGYCIHKYPYNNHVIRPTTCSAFVSHLIKKLLTYLLT